jgi:hypothetical protein
MQDETTEDPEKKLKLQIEEARRLVREDPEINEIIKSEFYKFYAENPITFRIRGRGEELIEKLQNKMESEYSRQTGLMRDRANVLKELAAVQKPRQPETEGEGEEFIRDLKISVSGDSDVKFQMPGKKGRTFNREDLGMHKSRKVWTAFREILQDPDHIYSLGKAAYIHSAKGKTRVKDYDAKRQLVLVINQKLIAFFEKNIGYFGIKFPKNFRLYEHRPNDPPRIFRFKFRVVEGKPVSDYSGYSKKEIIEEIIRLTTSDQLFEKDLVAAY